MAITSVAESLKKAAEFCTTGDEPGSFVMIDLGARYALNATTAWLRHGNFEGKFLLGAFELQGSNDTHSNVRMRQWSTLSGSRDLHKFLGSTQCVMPLPSARDLQFFRYFRLRQVWQNSEGFWCHFYFVLCSKDKVVL